MRYNNSKVLIFDILVVVYMCFYDVCVVLSREQACSAWISGWVVVYFNVCYWLIGCVDCWVWVRLCLSVCDCGVLASGGSECIGPWLMIHWLIYIYFLLLFFLCGIQISFNFNFDFFVGLLTNLIWSLNGCLRDLRFDWNLKI